MTCVLTAQEKVKQLIEFCGNLNYKQKIILSNEGNIRSCKDIYFCSQDSWLDIKPCGLWYGFGSAWLEQLLYTNEDWSNYRLKSYTHVYEIKLNRKGVIRIHNNKKFDEFTEKYSNKEKSGIDWKKVYRDGFDGIEIRFRHKREDIPWYADWDVSSGCIWNPGAVKEIKLLKCWEMMFKPV